MLVEEDAETMQFIPDVLPSGVQQSKSSLAEAEAECVQGSTDLFLCVSKQAGVRQYVTPSMK